MLHRVAALHAENLPAGFFAQLGSRYLRDYYRTFIDSPYAVAFTATLGGDPVGMAALLARPRQLLLFVRTRMARYVRALRRATGTGETASAPAQPDVAHRDHVHIGVQG